MITWLWRWLFSLTQPLFWWAQAAGAVAGLIGTHLTNRANQASTAEQMAFQAEMANTAHQRQVNDLRRAGLNPILSATGGGGAISPQGAHYQAADYSAGMSGSVSSAVAAMRNEAEVKVLKQQERKTSAEADGAESQASIADFERRVLDAIRHNFPESGVEAFARSRLEEAKASGTSARIERELDESSGELFRTLRRLGVGGSTAAQILRGVTSLPRVPGRGLRR